MYKMYQFEDCTLLLVLLVRVFFFFLRQKTALELILELSL